MKLYTFIPRIAILTTLSAKFSWSHFVEFIRLEDDLKRDFYISMCYNEKWSVRALRERINTMLFERTAISKKPEETIWLTQKAIGKLFGKSKATISEHIKKIYVEGKLQVDSTVRNFRTVQTEGSRQAERDLEFYNLDAIISVGYRVNSYQATQFRIRATKTLKEYIIKGVILDDKRLKQGNRVFTLEHFDKISINSNQIRTREKLRDTMFPKLMSREVRLQYRQEATI